MDTAIIGAGNVGGALAGSTVNRCAVPASRPRQETYSSWSIASSFDPASMREPPAASFDEADLLIRLPSIP